MIKVPFGKGAWYIVVHAGSENRSLDGAELVFKAKSTTGDYHDEMNSTFLPVDRKAADSESTTT